jgi:hypothetical protein
VQHSDGFNIHTAGVILMVVGAIGLIMTGIWMATRRRTEIVHQSSPDASRTTYAERPPAY